VFALYIGTSKVTSKGQLTIPQEIRDKRGLKEGTDVVVIDTDAGVLIKKSTDLKSFFSPFEQIAKKTKLNRSKLEKEIMAERKKTLSLFE